MGIIRRILPLLEDEDRGGRGGGPEIRVLVHQSRSGAVIGKAGNRIKDLRAVSSSLREWWFKTLLLLQLNKLNIKDFIL